MATHPLLDSELKGCVLLLSAHPTQNMANYTGGVWKMHVELSSESKASP